MSGEALYHGTRGRFRRGGYLFPHGDPANDSPANFPQHDWREPAVYVTPDLDLAKDFAICARGSGKPRVVEVRPLGPVTVDDATVNGAECETYRTPWAKVLRVVWIETEEPT